MDSGQQPAGEIDIRAITEDELSDWVQAVDASFLVPTPDGGLPYRREFFLPGRSLGAFAGQRCVGTFRSIDLEITVPGGAFVPAEGVTSVGVLPEYRRRGLLTQMMRMGLDDAVRRGRSLAALIASEYRIYGRFGFGPATSSAGYDIDVRRAGRVRVPGDEQCSVVQVSLDEARRCAPDVYDRFRRACVGALDRHQLRWKTVTGALRNPYHPRTDPTVVLCRDADGTPAGLAFYHVDANWTDGDPDYWLTARIVFAAHPAPAAALWRHLLGIEWVNRVTADNVAPDDPLPLLLDNPRACVTRPGTGADHLWLRILDVPRALQARAYEGPGRLVLDVADRLDYTAGRFAVDAAGDGTASVTRTDEPADLAVDVTVLGTLYLGDQTVRRLAAAGLVAEQRPGAVERADRMLRTTPRPWCPDSF